MPRHVKIEQTLLWLFVILSGIGVGTGLYEMRVIVPLWASAPPESVWYWEALRNTHPEYVPNAGLRLWIFLTPAHLLLALATLVAAWKTKGGHRRWLLASTVTFICLHLTAFVWFVPTINELMKSRELGISPEQVASKAYLWATLSWFRVPLGLFGFIAGLRALTLPPLRE
jgi:hypothetical protein